MTKTQGSGRRRAAVTLGLALALALTGCAGDDDGAGAGTSGATTSSATTSSATTSDASDSGTSDSGTTGSGTTEPTSDGPGWTYGSNAQGPTASISALQPGGARLEFHTGGVGSRAVIYLAPGDPGCPGSGRGIEAEVDGGEPVTTNGMDADLGGGVVATVVSPVAPLWETALEGDELTITATCTGGSTQTFVFPVSGLDAGQMPGFPEG